MSLFLYHLSIYKLRCLALPTDLKRVKSYFVEMVRPCCFETLIRAMGLYRSTLFFPTLILLLTILIPDQLESHAQQR